MIKRNLLITVLSLITLSCSSTRYSSENLANILSNSIAKSNFSNISVNIPNNWYEAEDNENKLAEIWLINNELNASLSFNAVNIVKNNLSADENPDLQSAADLLMLMRKAGQNNFKLIKEPASKIIGNRNTVEFEYLNKKGNPARTIVFPLKSKIYESTLVILNNSQNIPESMIRLQDAVVISAK
ncbi:MAG: hypothetical protein K9J16_04560 [Melioribacteraceae bacterium]|nr:hypothetical protein [Melioribacteraceae bacterium]MCF8354737.1 hypothetical protein [Melioribacteraceae bacterium]MCF8393241.1 hypothetical protein [Melioribacteraceae bacterium]MCF8417542.1 hypothetical protein [Melioribacteraceae bacterium]